MKKTLLLLIGISIVIPARAGQGNDVMITETCSEKSLSAAAVVSVTGDELRRTPAANLSEMLRGRVAGLVVAAVSGRPGSAPLITIRGPRSISGSQQPLFVVDGVPVSTGEFNSVNPADVERVDVLKDGASEALWGVKGANGVIVVTTRRGAQGVTVTLDAEVGVEKLWRNFDFRNAEDYFLLNRESEAARNYDYRTDYSGNAYTPELVLGERQAKLYRNGNWINWEDEVYKPSAVVQNYNLNVSGGGEKFRYSVGGGYYDQDGVLREDSGYKRYSARLNMDYTPRPWIALHLNTGYTGEDQRGEDLGVYNYLSAVPLGVFGPDKGVLSDADYGNSYTPLYGSLHSDRLYNADQARVGGSVALKPLPGLTFRFLGSYHRLRYANDSDFEASYRSTSSIHTHIEHTTHSQYLEASAAYSPRLGGGHSLDLTAGYVFQRDKLVMPPGRSSTGDGSSISDGSYGYANWDAVETGYNINSWTSGVSYDYRDRYLLRASCRWDNTPDKNEFLYGRQLQGSVETESKARMAFPAVSAAWRIDREGFMRSVRPVSELKLRLGWGKSGSQAGWSQGAQDLIGYLLYGPYLYGSQTGDTNGAREITRAFDLGLDAGFLQNRITFTADYYHSRTSDIVISEGILISGYTGYNTVQIVSCGNRAQGSGAEFSLGAGIIRKNDLRWDVRGTVAFNDNKISEVVSGPYEELTGYYKIGKPVNAYRVVPAGSLYQVDEFDFSDGFLPWLKTPAYPSEREFALPGHPRIDLSGEYLHMRRDPKCAGSLSTTLAWRGFDLFADLYWACGNYLLNDRINNYYSSNRRSAYSAVKTDYWTPSNPGAEYPRPGYAYYDIPSCQVQDASYVRLRTLTLGYTLPAALTRKAGMQRVRIYATATNLFTCTDVLSYSPEFAPGNYPETRSLRFGLNLGF